MLVRAYELYCSSITVKLILDGDIGIGVRVVVNVLYICSGIGITWQ